MWPVLLDAVLSDLESHYSKQLDALLTSTNCSAKAVDALLAELQCKREHLRFRGRRIALWSGPRPFTPVPLL